MDFRKESPVYFQAYRSTNQSIASASATQIQLNAKTVDTHGAFNTGTYLWTCPKTAYYLVWAKHHVGSDHAASTSLSNIIFLDGAGVSIITAVDAFASANGRAQTCILYIQKGQTLGMYTSSGSDASYTVQGGQSNTVLGAMEIV